MIPERIKQYLTGVRDRFNLEGITLTGAIGLLSIGLLPIHSTLTVWLHESSEHVSDEQMWMLAIAILGIVNAINIPMEAKTLEKTHYSSSATATALYDATGQPWLASIINHLQFYPRAIALNPVIYYKLWQELANRGGIHWSGLQDVVLSEGSRLTAESAVAVSATIGLWAIAFNYLILTDKTQPVVDAIGRMWTKVLRTLRGKQNQMFEIDLIQ